MRQWFRHVVVLLCCFVVCGMLSEPSFGLVNSWDHYSYMEAPPEVNDPGWDNIGRMSNGTGTYLGDGWILTAYHAYAYQAGHSGIELDRWYDEIPGTAQRIKYDSGTNADLVMFRINGNPDLDLINIREEALPDPGDPDPSEKVTIISVGKNRDGGEQDWSVDGTTYWGYSTTSTRVKQWGTNRISYHGPESSGSYGTTDTLYSTFTRYPYSASETQPVDKDSGGAAFTKLTSVWELTGVILLVNPNYPENDDIGPQTHAIYGSGAYYANLPTYYDQITTNRDIRLPGDADRDGRVDLVDLAILRGSFGWGGSDIPLHFNADFNDDDIVNNLDMVILEDHFGMVSGGYNAPDPPAAGAPTRAPVLAPEPATIFVLIGAVPLLLKSRTRRPRA